MRIAIVYNKPVPSYYSIADEQGAAAGVLTEVAAVCGALIELGHSVTCVSLDIPLKAARKKLEKLRADLVFNLFEGFCGHPDSEPDIPEILEELDMPYTGCPPQALKLALNKAGTKLVLKTGGIDTPDFQLLSHENPASFRLKYPCIVKPNGEDASHGISTESIVGDFPSLEKQLDRIMHRYGGGEILVETYIEGREFNATVVGNGRGQVLALSEIVFTLSPGMPRIITYEGKWDPESEYYRGTTAVCPAQIPEEERQYIAGIAETAFGLTGCRGYARVDMRMDGRGKIKVLEVNPNPDISPDSGAALQVRAAGLDYTRFIDKIVLLALEGQAR
jgi:D-alanine-D-alanine ligase